MLIEPITALTQLGWLLLAFVLTAIVGLERHLHHKPAGLRTQVLVGVGSAAFTLVSAYGFGYVLGPDVRLDPSRIAAQVVSGVGFLGAGVIFFRRDVVRGLTTAATVWVSAAIGMACGAGLPVVAVAVTGLHLATVYGLTALAERLPSHESRREVVIVYDDGRGVLRDVLSTATDLGFEATVRSTEVRTTDDNRQVQVTMTFRGRASLSELIMAIGALPGVVSAGPTRRDADEAAEDEV